MNNLEDWLHYLETMHHQSIDLGLDRILSVARKQQLHEFSIPVITVAGTNGKGSTVTVLSKLLQAANMRVATYTSPHLFEVNERIQINSVPIASEKLLEAFTYIESIRDGTSLTYFEFLTLAALWIFKNSQIDYLILEVGMGGRLDAVNIISPILAIITAIGYDHQSYLGNTLDEIAYEKAGIIREGIPVVLSARALLPTILDKTALQQNKVFIEDRHFFMKSKGAWQFGDEFVEIPQHNLPENSVSLAMAAYTILGYRDTRLPRLNTVIPSLTGLNMVGRFYSLSIGEKRIIFDVAHNPLGAKWLADQLDKVAIGPVLAVWSSLADKDLKGIVLPLWDKVKFWHVAPILHERAANSAQLRAATESAPVKVYQNLKIAFESALESAKNGDTILVFGSFYTVQEVMETHHFIS